LAASARTHELIIGDPLLTRLKRLADSRRLELDDLMTQILDGGAGLEATPGAAARSAQRMGTVAGLSLREAAESAARDAERLAICEALQATGGNKSRAARALRTDYKTLHVKMKNLGIRARDFSR
jgi:DNA-binding NtrC family response regulator